MDEEIEKLQRNLVKHRVKEELSMKILHVINNFKSTENPDIKLSNDDIINILSLMIVRQTQL